MILPKVNSFQKPVVLCAFENSPSILILGIYAFRKYFEEECLKLIFNIQTNIGSACWPTSLGDYKKNIYYYYSVVFINF